MEIIIVRYGFILCLIIYKFINFLWIVIAVQGVFTIPAITSAEESEPSLLFEVPNDSYDVFAGATCMFFPFFMMISTIYLKNI